MVVVAVAVAAAAAIVVVVTTAYSSYYHCSCYIQAYQVRWDVSLVLSAGTCSSAPLPPPHTRSRLALGLKGPGQIFSFVANIHLWRRGTCNDQVRYAHLGSWERGGGGGSGRWRKLRLGFGKICKVLEAPLIGFLCKMDRIILSSSSSSSLPPPSYTFLFKFQLYFSVWKCVSMV